jgi:hypothetical protein
MRLIIRKPGGRPRPTACSVCGSDNRFVSTAVTTSTKGQAVGFEDTIELLCQACDTTHTYDPKQFGLKVQDDGVIVLIENV